LTAATRPVNLAVSHDESASSAKRSADKTNGCARLTPLLEEQRS
jgi:hypothetical protein